MRNNDICIGTGPRSHEDLLAIDPVKGGNALGLRCPFSVFFLSPWMSLLSARILSTLSSKLVRPLLDSIPLRT